MPKTNLKAILGHISLISIFKGWILEGLDNKENGFST